MASNSMKHIPAGAQDEIRRRAIAALNNGFKQVEVSRLMSVPERTIRRWVAQMRRIEGMALGKMPDQLQLSFYLWTREAVGALIKREYGVALSPASIGNYLKRWGMSPQKPVRRAEH